MIVNQSIRVLRALGSRKLDDAPVAGALFCLRSLAGKLAFLVIAFRASPGSMHSTRGTMPPWSLTFALFVPPLPSPSPLPARHLQDALWLPALRAARGGPQENAAPAHHRCAAPAPPLAAAQLLMHAPSSAASCCQLQDRPRPTSIALLTSATPPAPLPPPQVPATSREWSASPSTRTRAACLTTPAPRCATAPPWSRRVGRRGGVWGCV